MDLGERILAGLEQHTSGDVLLLGQPVTGPGSDRGMVFQGYTLFPWLTVKKNVMFGLEVNGHGKLDSEREAMQWLQLIGLEKFADVYPHQLSGGMKQRVAIVRALANQPRILLMDEPFGALDTHTKIDMHEVLLRIWEREQQTVLFVTHDLGEALTLADRIILFSARPGMIKDIFDVDFARPRDAGDALLVFNASAAVAHLSLNASLSGNSDCMCRFCPATSWPGCLTSARFSSLPCHSASTTSRKA